MEIRGIITEVLPPREGDSQNGHWKTQEFVIEHGSVSYPRKACFTMRNSKLAEFGHLLVRGKRLTVQFDIDAREYQGRWYNTVTAYKLEELGQQQQAEHSPAAATATAEPFPPAIDGGEI